MNSLYGLILFLEGRMKYSYIIILFLPILVNANPFSSFNKSLSNELFFNQPSLDKYTAPLNLRTPFFWERMGTGAAYYRPLTNTIVLNKELLINKRIMNSIEMHQRKKYFMAAAETIFHEISHGVLDTIIENDRSLPSNYLLTKKIRNWFDSNYNSIPLTDAVHELYGYSAGNVISVLYNELDRTLLAHGLKYLDRGCFSKKGLKKIAKRIGLTKENIEFKTLFENKKFSDEFFPSYIFIRGKDYKIKDSFPIEWKKQLYYHFVEFYGLPITTGHFVKKMNRSKFYKNWLTKCYENVLE